MRITTHPRAIIRSLKHAVLITSGLLLNQATFARYDVVLENNTPHPVFIDTLSLDHLPEKAYGGWHQQLLKPYQRAKVQWFNFNESIKHGQNYRFQIHLRKSLSGSSLLTFETKVKGDFIGSHIASSYALVNGEKNAFTTKAPRPNFSTLYSQKLTNLFGEHDNFELNADFIKYTLPNPHANYQATDMVSYSINQQQAQYHYSNDPNELTALSYNVQLWPVYGNAGGINMNQASQRTRQIPKKIKHYDVVAVEELMDRDHRVNFSQLMLAQYPHQVAALQDIRPLSSGVKIFSRWPVIKHEGHIYEHCYKIDCGAAKGISYAAINKLGKTYHVFATHFQAATENYKKNDPRLTTREKQIVEAAKFIYEQNIPANEATIILGDFNVSANRCIEGKDCAEFNFLTTTLKANYQAHANKATLPYTADSDRNWMVSGESHNLIDYILPLGKDALLKDYQSRVLVLRGTNNAQMYVGKPYGDTDLSDHFAIEAKLHYKTQ